MSPISLSAAARRRQKRHARQRSVSAGAHSESEKRILATLDGAAKSGSLYANVPAADGRLLRLLAETANANHVVEIGTSTGLSDLWFCMALEKTGGKLTTFEFDSGRAAIARTLQASRRRLVTLVEGDAHQTVTRIKEPVDTCSSMQTRKDTSIT